MNKKTIIFIALLVLAFGLLFSYKAGVPSLFDDDEAKIAEQAREAVVTGDWVTLHFNFGPWFHKPPLYQWLTAGLFLVFGPSELMVRIWSMIFGIGSMLTTYLIARRLYDERVAGLSSIILGSSLLFLSLSRTGFVDTALTFFLALAILFFLIGYQDKKDAFIALSGAAAAFAILSKGPLGIILSGGAMGLYLLFRGDIAFFSRQIKGVLLGLLLCALIAPPWWIAQFVIHGSAFIEGMFGRYMIGIYTSTFEAHSGPIYFYVFVILFGMLPWSMFVLRGLVKALSREERERSLMLLCWAGLVFVLFSLAKTKVFGYILPLFPPLSILGARALTDILFNEKARAWSEILQTFAGLFILILGLFIATFLVNVPAEYVRELLILRSMLLSFSVLSAVALAASGHKKFATVSVTSLLLISVVFLIFAVEAILPIAEAYKPSPRLAEKVRAGVFDWRSADFYNYREGFSSSLVYYTQKKISTIMEMKELKRVLAGKKRAVIFTHLDILDSLKGELPRGARVLAKERNIAAFVNF